MPQQMLPILKNSGYMPGRRTSARMAVSNSHCNYYRAIAYNARPKRAPMFDAFTLFRGSAWVERKFALHRALARERNKGDGYQIFCEVQDNAIQGRVPV
jgi:hypothetical protein